MSLNPRAHTHYTGYALQKNLNEKKIIKNTVKSERHEKNNTRNFQGI